MAGEMTGENDKAPQVETTLTYESPLGFMLVIDASAATLGASGSSVDTQRMSWRHKEFDNE